MRKINIAFKTNEFIKTLNKNEGKYVNKVLGKEFFFLAMCTHKIATKI